ncbi:MAG: hypothetical protein Q7V15_04010 [Phenylobacterium sp.]|uniref:hypothetical protein n=1 Tax=Phenylobacterium sp. TaxID=1871053 RepID=UPI0027270F35|nr:hypothetical protein [Phenylobacterium sp.]MDO8900499.1 hypothetical protein [Phenylobacterium sp.]
MRTSTVSSIIAALGLALVLTACDERPPKPPFAEKAAPPAAAPAGQASIPETLPPARAVANCCACPPAKAACPETKPVQTAKAPTKPAARPRSAPVRQARAPAPRPPAPRQPAPAPRDYAHQAPPAGHQQDYRRYQGPDIATRGGYERRAESHQGQHEQYRGGAYRQERYAYAPPPPPPQVRGYAEQHQSYSEHRSYSQQSSGYAHTVAAGPCCAGPPVQAAGRDPGGYLTWPGKRPPAPYY